MTSLATSIPGSSNNGYVAAAYIVFFTIVLIYVAIMAVRAQRLEGELTDLQRDVEAARRGTAETPESDREPRPAQTGSVL